MAWRNKNNEEVSLEDLGFSDVEALKARLAEIEGLKQTNAGLSNTVQAQATEVASVKQALSSLEERITTLSTPQNNNQGGGSGNGRVEIPSVNDDENAAFAARMAPLYEQNMQNTAVITEDRVLRRLAGADPYFSKIETEVRSLIARTPLQMRANLSIPQGSDKSIAEQVIENAYFVVKGKKADQIRTDSLAGKGEFFIEPARSSSQSTQVETKEKTVNDLSDEDRRIIERMNIKPETYVKLINDGGPNMGGSLINKQGF